MELGRKNVKVAGSSEDWIWYQLGLIREAGAVAGVGGEGETYDLADLGRQLLKFGNDKFDSNGTKPFTWFNLLLFTAQFERVSPVVFFIVMVFFFSLGFRFSVPVLVPHTVHI